ncbi:MAG: MFS transporter [Geminicoccaceae bacterium]
MSTPAPGSRIGLVDLVAYGALGLPLAALNLPLALYIPTYYTSELGVGLFGVGIAIAAARILDLVTDPLLGALSDRLPGSFGRRKTAILIGVPIMLLATHFLFRPDVGAGAGYLFFWCSIAYLGWTLVILAYSAWGAEISTDYHERSRIATARESAVIVGVMIAAAAPVITGSGGEAGPALSFIAISMTVLVPLTVLLLFWRTPEVAPEQAGSRGWKSGWQALLNNRPLRRLLFAHLLNGLANGLPATLFLLFVTHRLAAPEWTGIFLLAYFASGVLAAPFWLRLSYRIGKHRAWATALGWAAIMFSVAPFLGEGDILPFAAMAILSGASLGADLALPASMHADMVDLDAELSGRRRAGFLFALWGMATKLSLALAVLFAFGGLEMAGFDQETGENSLPLALLYGALPVPFKLAAVLLVWRFDEAPRPGARSVSS